MKYRKLGSTGCEVSILGFGTSPFGDVYGRTSTAQIQRAVDAAIDLGVNFFDTSPYYGLTLAEERLGNALQGNRNKILLATKCGRYGMSEFDFSRASIRASVEASLRRLRTDHVDLLQAHDIEFGHESQIVEETLPAMRELQAEGKTRFIGITAYPVKLLRRVAEAAPVDTILSYCRYSLRNTDMEDVLAPLAKHTATGLINASPLMMGLLTRSGVPAWHPASPELKEAGRRADAAAESEGGDLATLALQFAVTPTFAASTLIGMATAEEVERNVRAISGAANSDVLRTVRAVIGNGFATTWVSGLAENAD
ncbi:L-galactose dehydrogenase [Granulicella aggregans]|uniref:L-galactose dehydrogenase n=1 Tax=Granulicella aggregans TaxID=474949 RepID=A0A7W7ZIU6_9BACT|nr:aldo/keto reductase [Granulicella aggregans]MBB5060696.1 L-galactose dehydrogenase [Granulicella aggregans]